MPTLWRRRPHAAAPDDGDFEGPLASMPLDVLQKILVQVPLESRLKPAFAAKFLWLAASSPTAAGRSSPLGPLLPPPAPSMWPGTKN